MGVQLFSELTLRRTQAPSGASAAASAQQSWDQTSHSKVDTLLLSPFLRHTVSILVCACGGWVKVTRRLPVALRFPPCVGTDNPALPFPGRPGGAIIFTRMKSYIKQYHGFCQHQAFRPLFCPLSQTYFYWPWITISHFPFAFAIPYVSSGTQYAENQVVKDLAVNLRHFINSTFKSLVTMRTGGGTGGLFGTRTLLS